MKPPRPEPSPVAATSRVARAHHSLVRIFVTGLLAALPLAATLALFAWVFDVLARWLGPSSAVGRLLIALGVGLTGSQAFGYLLGLAVVLALVFGLGLLVDAGLERGMARAVDAVMRRIPLVRSVYELMQKMVGLFGPGAAGGGSEGLKSMSPVWCHFGGPQSQGAATLALLGSPQPVQLNGLRYLAVLIPTSPVPVGGGLIYVPESWVTPADVGVEGLTSIYVSMGLTSSQHLK